MSTKIYNGYRLADGTDLIDFAARLRPIADRVRDQADARLLIDAATELHDERLYRMSSVRNSRTLTDLPSDAPDHWRSKAAIARILHERGHASDLSLARNRFEADQLLADERGYDADPHRLEFIVLRDEITGTLGVLLYCENSMLRGAFESMPEVSEYGYWDNSDRPSSISDEQWDERRASWEAMVPYSAVPGDVALLSFDLRASATGGVMSRFAWSGFTGTTGPYHGLLTSMSTADVRERAERLARDAVTGVRFARLKDPSPEGYLDVLLDRRTEGISAVTDAFAEHMREIDVENDLMAVNPASKPLSDQARAKITAVIDSLLLD